MTAGSLWLPVTGAAVAAAAALVVLFRHARRLPQAMPGPRSLHARPVPRVGGLSVWAGFAPDALLPGVPSLLGLVRESVLSLR